MAEDIWAQLDKYQEDYGTTDVPKVLKKKKRKIVPRKKAPLGSGIAQTARKLLNERQRRINDTVKRAVN